MNEEKIENDEQARLERGRAAQEEVDNNVARPKLTRHQMMQRTKRDNPDIKIGSDLFREAFVLNAFNQEGDNLARLAAFTGMSKGEVRNHLIKISRKLEAAKREFAEQLEQKLREQQQNATEATNESAVSERQGADDRTDVQEPDAQITEPATVST